MPSTMDRDRDTMDRESAANQNASWRSIPGSTGGWQDSPRAHRPLKEPGTVCGSGIVMLLGHECFPWFMSQQLDHQAARCWGLQVQPGCDQSSATLRYLLDSWLVGHNLGPGVGPEPSLQCLSSRCLPCVDQDRQGVLPYYSRSVPEKDKYRHHPLRERQTKQGVWEQITGFGYRKRITEFVHFIERLVGAGDAERYF